MILHYTLKDNTRQANLHTSLRHENQFTYELIKPVKETFKIVYKVRLSLAIILFTRGHLS